MTFLTENVNANLETIRSQSNLNYRVQTNNIAIIESHRETRSKNTNRSYNYGAKWIQEWCSQQPHMPDNDTVTAGKLALWLNEVVFKGSRSKSEYYTPGSVESLVCGVIDLWKYQRGKGMNSNPHPRDDHVKAALDVYSRHFTALSRDSCRDRGINHVRDGLIEPPVFEAFGLGLLGPGRETGLRNRFCFLLSFATLLRMDNVADLELADLAVLELYVSPTERQRYITYYHLSCMIYSRRW